MTQATEMTLKQARQTLEQLPATILAAVSEARAQTVERQLREAGATTAIRRSFGVGSR